MSIFDDLVYGHGFYDCFVGDSNGKSANSDEASLKTICATDAAEIF